MARFTFIAAGLAILGSSGAVPIQDTNSTPSSADMLKVIREVGIAKAIRGSCTGQSCAIADLSGSTGNPVKIKPQGGDENGYKCLAKYNPEGAAAVAKAPMGPPQNNGMTGALMGALTSLSSAAAASSGKVTDTGKFTGQCTKNILLFARGTMETGLLGVTVGPALSQGLTGKAWSVVGIPYDADMAGDACLGLPGGMVAKDMINQAAKKCPNSKLFVSGYSEGGMVAHNGVAYADKDAKKRVFAVLAFGDPFQGAKIKGYDGPILTYCNEGDAICTGNFDISAAHLAYTGSTAQTAIKELLKLAAK
ncbi:hypothetical protein E2P81_ATG03598 [Venturia nashicola]|uniref:cutinase n=1 Tax=Venturia nashicola TaxID=86259 RepID=A0A4Z1PEC1_9PEZI|nr:hypothetical protein E6O75_ATG03672 [Venturia nashicola]TLD37923.1 hypothetical protein E2P81_ATG03598 [Venturia nashicola]